MILTIVYKVEIKLDSIKEENNLTETSVVHNAPPLIAFTTVALGGFRGIVADMLWLRTIILQSQGKYFEMVQLASWISKLQPGFTGTTTFLAWNMAYNISVTYANPKDKWRWVQNGINILKDAIKNTPNKPDLYCELAFIYLNKIGNIFDSSHLYYRNQIAKDMYEITGTWTPDWHTLANAPKNSNELTKILKQKYGINNIFDKTDYTPVKLQIFFNKNNKLPSLITDLLKNLKNRDNASTTIKTYLRRNRLISELSLDPAKILELNKNFGPIDWNLFQTHSLYWLYTAPEDSILNDYRFLSRFFASVDKALANGRLLLFNSNNDNEFFTGPNIEIIEPTQKFIYKLSKKTEHKDTCIQQYKAFMNAAILQLFIQNKNTQAEKYLNMLKNYYPEDANYNLPLNTFIEHMLPRKYSFHSKTAIKFKILNLIKLSLIYSEKKNNQPAKGFMNFAKMLHTIYNENNKNKLPNFGKMKDSINVENIKNNLIRKT